MSDNVLNFIKKHTKLEKEVRKYISLKRCGIYFKGICLFSAKHEPLANDLYKEFIASHTHLLRKKNKNVIPQTFVVSPQKQIYYCFGCHAGGDIISFVGHMQNVSPFEAIKILADSYNITIPAEIAID